MGGFHPSGSNGEQAGRRYLDDAYRFTPKQGWTQIADRPIYCVVSAVLGSEGGWGGFLETAHAAGKFHMLDWS